MCEWTGQTDVPIFQIDEKINLADLLKKHHKLSVQSVTLHSEWQNGLRWMRMDTENMPLLSYNQLRVENIVEEVVKAECYDDAMTSEFSQFEENTVLLVHDQLMVEKPIEEQVMINFTESISEGTGEETEDNGTFLAAVGSARVQVNLLVDPVLHGLLKI